MIKVICDRCGTEIPRGGKIWDILWSFKFTVSGESYDKREGEEWNICECCKKEILFFITHKQGEEAEEVKKKPKAKIDHKKVREMKEAGMKNAEIAQHFGTTAGTIANSLSTHKEFATQKETVDPKEVVAFYRAGWDVAKIANEMGCEDVEKIKKIILRAAAEEAAS